MSTISIFCHRKNGPGKIGSVRPDQIYRGKIGPTGPIIQKWSGTGTFSPGLEDAYTVARPASHLENYAEATNLANWSYISAP